MRTSRRPAALLALLAATALLAGCGDEAEMAVELFPADRFAEVTLTVEDRDGTRTFERADLEPPTAPTAESRLTRVPTLTTGRFRVAGEGRLKVRVEVEEDGRTVADGAVRFDAVDDFRWRVFAAFLGHDPTEGCFGCRGAEAFPVAEEVRTAPAESLWVWWTGRREGDDLVF